jgi:hypothetical protein
MDRLAPFPASDVDGMLLVDIRVLVVYIPRPACTEWLSVSLDMFILRYQPVERLILLTVT